MLLSGVSKAVRKSVQSQVTAFFSTASPTGWGNEVCDLSGSTKGEIYKGRYLSVLMQWHGCTHVHSLKTLNIDLKTGKPVKLSQFLDNRKNVFWNVLNREAGFDTSGVWRSWNVGSKGVKAYAFDGESWFYSVTVPWNKVLKPGKTAGKKKYSSKAPLRCMGAGKAKVTVQGSLVTATYTYSGGGAIRFYGVRGSAKTTVAMTPKYSPSGGSTVKITFASKSSKVATLVTPLDFC